MTYMAELADANRTLFFGNAEIEASTDADAIGKAKNWARLPDHFREDAWLFVVCGSRGVTTFKPGTF